MHISHSAEARVSENSNDKKREVRLAVHRDKILIIKPTRITNFSNLFWNAIPHTHSRRLQINP